MTKLGTQVDQVVIAAMSTRRQSTTWGKGKLRMLSHEYPCNYTHCYIAVGMDQPEGFSYGPIRGLQLRTNQRAPGMDQSESPRYGLIGELGFGPIRQPWVWTDWRARVWIIQTALGWTSQGTGESKSSVFSSKAVIGPPHCILGS